MNQSIDVFFDSLKGKTVAFIGIGISHIPTIKQFASKGIATIACDKRPPEKFDPTLLAEFSSLGVRLVLGGFSVDELGADIIFRTPGFYFLDPALTSFREKGGIVTSEMEVFFDLCPATTIAITGSDGKTTTSTLIAKTLEASGKTVHLGGNIGKALLPIIETITPSDFVVVELSSFQLISMRPSPDISVVTNVSPNHLDVHKNMAEYIDAKRNIFTHQNAFSKTVFNEDDQLTLDFSQNIRGRLSTFSMKKPVTNGAFLDGDTLVYVKDCVKTPLFNKSEILLPGLHNVANYLTAISAVWGYVTPEAIHRVATSFNGVEHRIEFVRELGGVRWYNDSIATSPTRAVAGLRSFNHKVILLAGGYDKHLSYASLAPEILANVKLLILTGATAEAIEREVLSHPDFNPDTLDIVHAKDIPEAVEIANKNAVAGDIVTLSPASASFDVYTNFEERGRHFKSLVNSL